MAGEIGFVWILDAAVENVDAVFVSLQPNVKIERFALGVPLSR